MRRPYYCLLLLWALVLGCTLIPFRHDESRAVGRRGADGPHGSTVETKGSSKGCVTCHAGIESPSMHAFQVVKIGCTQCHGGDATVKKPSGTDKGDRGYAAAQERAHVAPAFPEEWHGAANPKTSYALLNRERLEFVRFINPGDLRVADVTCGGCHPNEVDQARTSIMAHSAMVPGAGTYANGVLPYKNYILGEFYMPDGRAAAAITDPPPTKEELARGVLPALYPYPRFEISQPGNIFRTLERGNADNLRGLGTEAKVDAAVVVVTKTRLNDPTLWFLGNNDYAADYRSSGCTACHVMYANDDSESSGPWAKFGRRGRSHSDDPTVDKKTSGHPIRHAFTRSIPNSQCMTCHLHQGNGALGNYAGIMWWDGETDAEWFYNKDGSLKTGKKLHDIDKVVNPKSKISQFSALHRSSWSFRKIYKRNESGGLLDAEGKIVSWDDPKWYEKAVHLTDAHFDAGMHCIDCHTRQDVHGDGKLYGQMIDVVEIACIDCHGTVKEEASLVTSNPSGGNDLAEALTPFDKPWFERLDGKIIQHSKVTEGLSWDVPQIVNMIDPDHESYNRKAAIAKTIQKSGEKFGDPCAKNLAHENDEMTCYACHTSWSTSCSGCHLANKANARTKFGHFWGEYTQNDVGYFSQGLRQDLFMLGKHGRTQKYRIGPVRSASAVTASTENANRAIVTVQQPTIAASGHSGMAFSPFVPHTVRVTETRQCSDCHISKEEDNNARLAVLFNLGTQATDLVGPYAWLATGAGGISAVRVTDGWEPQPVIGSNYHRLRFPKLHAAHVENDRTLVEEQRHGSRHAQSLQIHGEYMLVADGPGGFRAFDIANVANKDVAQRIVTAPFSPLGHDTHIESRNATAVLVPSSVPLDPRRVQDPASLEDPVHPLFGYAFITDSEEGLICVDINTLVDGNPENNYLKRAATYNPKGRLDGARGGVVAGHYLYVLTPRGVAVVDIDTPDKPRLVHELGDGLNVPRAVDLQFRYAALVDKDGFKVLDITDLSRPRLMKKATIPLADARHVQIARTYAYVAAGKEGVAIIDVKRFRRPKLKQMFSAGGKINDAHAVTAGLAYSSFFLFVADGKNGLRVVELWAPHRYPGIDGYSPPPMPQLLASYRTKTPAIAISEGLARDRGVDESGNQVSVYGRLGSRPLNLAERRRFYLRDKHVYRVTDEPSNLSRVKYVRKKKTTTRKGMTRLGIRVRLAGGDKDLADARVTLVTPRFETLQSEDGVYMLPPLPAGSKVQVRVKHADGKTRTIEFTLGEAGETQQVTLEKR